MAEQQNGNAGDIKEVVLQTDLLKNCMKKFPELEGKVKSTQLASIQLKYQYFLRKFHKYTEEHQKYKNMYRSIERTVDDSTQIREENRSIQFIKKIMEDTEKKYNKLKQNVEQLKIQKDSTFDELTSLTNDLKQLKNQFFQLKRKEEEGQTRVKEQELQIKTKENFKNMFKIRHEKKLTQVLAKKIKPIACSPLVRQTSVAERKMQEFEKINKLKEDFLREIGINHQEFYKLSERELKEQCKLNKLLTKKTFAHIKSQLLKHNPVETEKFQVFKIANEHDKEYQEFMRLPTRDLIQLIIKQNKVGQVLQMIEQQKRTAVAAYQVFKSSKTKCL